MFDKCGGKCPICNKQMVKESSRISNAVCVDHCHVTGKVRGLICSNCNLLLGKVSDDPELLRRAADYLEDKLNGKV